MYGVHSTRFAALMAAASALAMAKTVAAARDFPAAIRVLAPEQPGVPDDSAHAREQNAPQQGNGPDRGTAKR